MANLSVEEPDALMCARPDLWEPRVGNDPGPPGPVRAGTFEEIGAEVSLTRQYDEFQSAFRIRSILHRVCLRRFLGKQFGGQRTTTGVCGSD